MVAAGAGSVVALLVTVIALGPGTESGRPVAVAGAATTSAASSTVATTTESTVASTAPSASAPAPVAGGSLGGCPSLPAGDVWHADVSKLPVLQRSGQYVAGIGAEKPVKADFGSGEWEGAPIGIPLTYVGGGQGRVAVTFEYADESDPGPYPVPRDAAIEGGANGSGDRHVLVVDTVACRLYELFDARPQANGSWHAGSGAIFDLRSDKLRPVGWTSADAAGLPVAPGLVRYEEVAAGRIDHAIRVTVPHSQRAYLWPARHAASTSDDPALPPMGLRLRLRSTVDTSRLPAQARVIAEAMKTYGVIVADNGSPWFLSGTPDQRWGNDALRALGSLNGNDFEAVDTSVLLADKDSGRVR
jgi:hypothetical protein